MAEFIYVVRPPRATFVADATDEERSVIGAHFRFLQGLLAEGKLLTAGRCESGAFGIAIFEAADEAEARAIMAADPAIAAGLFRAELHAYRTALLRGRE